MFGGFITGLIRMILPMYLPMFIKNIIDRVLLAEGLSQPERFARLWGMMPLFLCLVVVHLFMTLGRFYLPHVAATGAIRDIRFTLYRHIQRLSLGFHNKRPSGAVVSRLVNDVATAQSAFEGIFVIAMQMLMEATGIAAYLLYRDWLWALVSFCVIPIFLIASRLVKKPMRLASKEALEATSQMSSHLHERIAMIREVQAFTAESYEEQRLYEHADDLRHHTLRQALLNGWLVAATELTRILGLAGVMIFGVWRVTTGHATVGDVTAFYLYVGMLIGPMEVLVTMYGARIHQAIIASDRIFEFLDAEPAIQDRPGAAPLRISGPPEVRFENVSFSYPVEEPLPILHGVSFTAPPGARVVLAGPSGAGKSTLLNLIPRFYDIRGGRILINGQEIRFVTHRSLRQAVAIVPQEPVLFTGTIRENILYGKMNATEEELRAAAREANAEPFILEQPNGYDTEVGERGVGLSGGQIQRIAIARAFLKNPAILLMDEATSNLDATSEQLVLQALDRLAAGRTTFIIAHRLSVARRADMILVLEGGAIVESGVHEDLLARGGLYATLWRQQMASA